MYDQKYFITTKVRGVIIHDEKLFLCKMPTNERGTGFYCLPGGTLEPNEKRLECLEREIIEELGVKPVIGKLIYTQEFVRDNGTTIFDFWYEITNNEDFLNVDISKCSHGFENERVGFYGENYDFDLHVKPDHIWELLEEWRKERDFIQNT